jgi:hypothetical protein
VKVFIVVRDGKVDEVFYTMTAAKAHADNWTKKWSITEIIEKTVLNL